MRIQLIGVIILLTCALLAKNTAVATLLTMAAMCWMVSYTLAED